MGSIGPAARAAAAVRSVGASSRRVARSSTAPVLRVAGVIGRDSSGSAVPYSPVRGWQAASTVGAVVLCIRGEGFRFRGAVKAGRPSVVASACGAVGPVGCSGVGRGVRTIRCESC